MKVESERDLLAGFLLGTVGRFMEMVNNWSSGANIKCSDGSVGL